MSKPDSSKIIATVARVCLLLIAAGPTQYSASLAQVAKSGLVTVSQVSTRSSAQGTVVSIAADGPLSRAQTWQDREGYHVVVPLGATPKEIKIGNGIKLTQLDHSLEILVQTKPGANVTVHPTSNRLNLTVEGKLETRTAGGKSMTASSPTTEADSNQPADEQATGKLSKESVSSESLPATPSSASVNAGPTYIAQGPGTDATSPAATQPGAASSEQPNPIAGDESSGWFSTTTVIVIFALGLAGLVFIRWRQSKGKTNWAKRSEPGFSDFDNEPAVKSSVESGLIKSNGANGANGDGSQRKAVTRLPVVLPASLFGAFQVDQEVAKLVMGQPHKMEVLASRAPDDRRAIEASLLKALVSTSEDERRRVRDALEEYGFVARQNAAVLLAVDPYDRTSAARMLGDIKSPSALPFLLEALYDNESIVRNQAVLSIGELRLPSAIGALLDIARKHTDVPGALLSRALSACSVEGLDFFDNPIPEPGLLTGFGETAQEIKKLKPASAVKELPETVADEKFVEALAKLDSLQIVERAEGLKQLAQFEVRESVSVLAKIARRDAKPNLRALAIASLAAINHESVFPSVLIGMADESREVRAAAARALSRLSFDRADAYIRVMETDDAATLREVAQACVKAGVASQAIDRLASNDRRQAYEALSLVTLLAQADVLEPIVAAIENHHSLEVRIGAVRLLGTIGHPGMLAELKEIATELLPPNVRTILADTIAELEAAGNAAESPADAATDRESAGMNHQPPPQSPKPADPLEQFHLNNTDFADLDVEVPSNQANPEHHEFESSQSAEHHVELEGVDCQCAPDQRQLSLESQADEPQAHRLDCVSDRPQGDTSGLPAPPIA
jgi:HEAT repeat protein